MGKREFGWVLGVWERQGGLYVIHWEFLVALLYLECWGFFTIGNWITLGVIGVVLGPDLHENTQANEY